MEMAFLSPLVPTCPVEPHWIRSVTPTLCQLLRCNSNYVNSVTEYNDAGIQCFSASSSAEIVVSVDQPCFCRHSVLWFVKCSYINSMQQCRGAIKQTTKRMLNELPMYG